ncbi:MAG: hypothetical protein A2Z99_08620 [Treponema sp. GWB1_62_6]|nr:MAG: hypothetical protein A2001_13225 [Treponema sp. GWC1_61_84]OHE69907.1 MAG: hypothetical protein A2Z99_08620 [Treponema sp. GWB1_62_6]OHE72832.1 MAG: hypothetical protein A2413_02355 [Treponema sp. RIFOXYC1_FULL_61_9]HCM27823.1 hypothetical protein [Treponema sp.]
MAECECLAKCPFFHDKMANKPATSQIMKNQYCLGDSTGCARHRVFKAVGGQHVPGDLFPSQTKRIRKIIADIRKA